MNTHTCTPSVRMIYVRTCTHTYTHVFFTYAYLQYTQLNTQVSYGGWWWRWRRACGMYASVHVCVYVCTKERCMYACMVQYVLFERVHACEHVVCTQTSIHLYVYVCMYVPLQSCCMYACIFRCVHFYACTHTHASTWLKHMHDSILFWYFFDVRVHEAQAVCRREWSMCVYACICFYSHAHTYPYATMKMCICAYYIPWPSFAVWCLHTNVCGFVCVFFRSLLYAY